MRSAPVVLLLLPLLAGCLTEETEPCPTTFIPHGDDHDHRNAESHRIACGASVLAHDDLARFGRSEETVVGAHAVAVHGALAAVAVNGGDDGGQQGFHLFDTSDPKRPRHLAFWDAGVEVNGDRTIAFAPDGQTVFLGFEDGPRPGIAAIDVSDPRSPAEVAFWSDPLGYGPHTVHAGDIGGQTHVFALALGVAILRYDGAFSMESRFVTQDERAILDSPLHFDPSNPSTYPATYALRALYGHDMMLVNDGPSGKDLLMVAYGYDGAKVVDVTDPRLPVLQASWVPPADSSHKHYTHSMTATRIDGRLVAVVGSETFEPENQDIASPLWILDITGAVEDAPLATDMRFISTWRNPDGAPAGSLGLSVHFFRLHEGGLYVSHYHGGIWRIDISSPAARSTPMHTSMILPVPAAPAPIPEDCCIGFDLDGVPMVFDVAVDERGIVHAADLINGYFVVKMD